MPAIDLPAGGWRPRPYQRALWDHLDRGGTRAIEIGHRRWGKDEVLLHRFACAAFERVGNYWHLLPEARQARKALWDAVNPHTGRRRIDEAFPAELRRSTSEVEMMIEFINGSTYQIGGSDNYNSLVGSTPIGIGFSEWALSNPRAWAYLRPILAENGGWAVFISTPRGKNHCWSMYESAKGDRANWFCEMSDATKTGVFSAEILEREKAELIREYGIDEGEALYRQEYLCSFEAAIRGAYYARDLERLDKSGQVCSVPWEPKIPVVTAWDIGYGDSTAIWFAQAVGREIHIIDYYEANGTDIGHYVRELQQKPYVYGEAILPHDAAAGELGTGKSISRMLQELGVRNRVLKRGDVDSGIHQVRQFLPKCWFDAKKCAAPLELLRQYRREYDEDLKTFKQRPLHDYTSHCADAMRYLAVGFKDNAIGNVRVLKYPNMAVA